MGGSDPMVPNGFGGWVPQSSLPSASSRPPGSGGAAPPPQTAPMPPTNVPPYQPPGAQTFTGRAPTPTPYGDFAGLDPRTFEHSPDFQYLMDTSQKALQRGAASRGTLLTGGFQKELQKNASGLAAGDFQNAYDRALGTYNTNRATNAQNFGQSMDSFSGGLNAFRANTDAALGFGRLGLDSQRQAYGQARDTAGDIQANQQGLYNDNAARQATQQAAVDDAYARSVAATRDQNAALSAAYRAPIAKTPSWFAPSVKVPAGGRRR